MVLVSPFLAAAGVRKRGVHSLTPASLALGWQMAPELCLSVDVVPPGVLQTFVRGFFVGGKTWGTIGN